MDTNQAAFVGSIPDFYDRGLGPVIFADYAAEMARRVATVAPRRVLETAAGTGIVTLNGPTRMSSSTGARQVASLVRLTMCRIVRPGCSYRWQSIRPMPSTDSGTVAPATHRTMLAIRRA